MTLIAIRAPLALVLVLAGSALAGSGSLTLSPVGVPMPGQAPVGLAVAETGRTTYAVIADFEGDQVRSVRPIRTPERSRRSAPSRSPMGRPPWPWCPEGTSCW